MDLKGFDAFEAMIHSGFSDSEHPIEELVGGWATTSRSAPAAQPPCC
jgi:hypothetical protein